MGGTASRRKAVTEGQSKRHAFISALLGTIGWLRVCGSTRWILVEH